MRFATLLNRSTESIAGNGSRMNPGAVRIRPCRRGIVMVIRWPLAFTQLEKSPFHISGVGTLRNAALFPLLVVEPS
jgi:hypothetical protein